MVRTAAGLAKGWRSSYVSSDPRHRPQSSRVQHRCPGRARQYRAGRVFLAGGDSARIINPPTDRWARRQNTAESVQDAHNLPCKLWQRCSTARLVPRCTRYLYHNERHPMRLLTIYAAEAFALFGSGMGQGVEVPHSSTMGAVMMGYRGTARQPYSARRRTSRRCSPQGAIAGEPGIPGLRT
jgi:hypothetical protein